MLPVTRTPMQSSLMKRTLPASPRELDAKLELLQQLGYADRFYLDDHSPDASISDEKAHYLDRDTDRWIQTEYNWALEEAAESAASIPDLFDGALSVCLCPRMRMTDGPYTSQSKKTKKRVCRMCTTRPSSLPDSRGRPRRGHGHRACRRAMSTRYVLLPPAGCEHSSALFALFPCGRVGRWPCSIARVRASHPARVRGVGDEGDRGGEPVVWPYAEPGWNCSKFKLFERRRAVERTGGSVADAVIGEIRDRAGGATLPDTG